MGELEGWAQPASGLLLNGLLPNEAASVMRVLDSERWTKAEERTAELIACIQPNPPSEERRIAVADYVQRLIIKCFPCQVFTFGSVPLKTYLPDGDIDLTAFSKTQSLKDSWAHQVRDMLENEEKNENAEFRVKEVQYIQAEVKIIKCLVENIVVDISFNQLGGLCTLCFLEEVDHLINQNHLFKRSIILIKAWCYYESRILGAHHGLISTYALETLVLYIFHVFNNSFAGPLEVLYRFLEFFSKFDWENFCVSLRGPVPISSLPDVTAEPPRKDGGELLLSEVFLDACSSVYAVRPGGQENQGQAFVSKHFNVIDPLRINNNLGRSVSKGNFFRIRSAFAFGAKRLARLLDCSKEDLCFEVNQFFLNTWDRHGSGHRPDAPHNDLRHLRLSNADHLHGSENRRNNLSGKKNESSSGRDTQGTQGMHQEEQDLVNMMASSAAHGFNGQVHLPLNLGSGHLPFPIPSSVLASMGYAQRNMGGMFPTNFPLMESPWGTNMHFPQGVVPSPLTHYFPGMGLTSNPEESVEPGNEDFGSVEMNSSETDHDFWHNQERGSTSGFDHDNGGLEMLEADDRQQSTSAGYNSHPSSRIGAGVSSMRVQQKSPKESRDSTREDHVDDFQYQDNRGNEVYFDDRVSSRSLSANYTSSARSKTSSESSWEGSSAKVSKSTREKRGRKAALSTAPSTSYGKGKSVSEHSSTQADDENKDWNLPTTLGAEMVERSTLSQPVASLHVPRHQMPGFEPSQTSGSDSLMPFPVLLGPGSRQRATNDSGATYTFYPTGPPVPFVTMLPYYNFPAEAGTSDVSSQFSREDGPESDSGQNFDSAEGIDQPELRISNSMGRVAPIEPSEYKSDILHSDFASHYQNLQYGRLCQNPRHSPPMVYPSPVMVPPAYLQGRFPWDGPGRPLSANMNLITQLMNYGPRVVPVAAPLQSVSNRPASVYQRYVDEIPRYRSGTGTYLPNPKVSARDRHTSSARRGSFNYDRNDHHGDREGNWNANSKSRASARNHSRSQAEKPNSRVDRMAASESRAERPWSSHRHDSFPSYQSQNGPIRSSTTQSGSTNVAYGMYPLPGMNPGGVSSNGPTMPPLVMLYPYDQNAGYGPPPAEQLEFGSLGPVGFSGLNEASQLNEGSRMGGVFEEQRFHGGSTQRSSPDQPSSPHIQRGV
ncbi:uncharacterized protein LOC112181964 isoform X3 [Rosa chinensis]|uniref:uncharacterized protein LOC112181964 isoform X3 n=1 Tax=Rosa chinensis TaxID=74649 RepID=UPI001AD9408D|nr:uncharacterized protein LOC112181964 isoform X3 [Rosa chinensis]